MRFGGHETFPVREGWLLKGLELLRDHPERQADLYVADHLGVGRNMAKSIWHWLKVTRLVDILRGGNSKQLAITDIGQCILAHDPYMIETGTWWALHANLVTQNDHAIVWSWFFNDFSLDRFDRTHCLEQLARRLEVNGVRRPSHDTLTRDLQCLLQSYARPIPAEIVDPEDANECPFRDLGLINHYRDTGIFEVQRDRKVIPPEIFGYIIALAHPTDEAVGVQRIPIKDVLSAPGMPGQVLALSGDALIDALHEAETLLGDSLLSVRALAGDRVLQISQLTAVDWLNHHYEQALAS